MKSAEIIQLRKRLGWTVHDLSRRLGVETKVVQSWEIGSAQPDLESLAQLQYLSNQAGSNSFHIQASAAIETFMFETQVDQIHIDEYQKRKNKLS